MQVGASHFLDVPRIVVVGDQSAGKSSIIQRICGVDLPRSEGTCTRCPMEVRPRLLQAACYGCLPIEGTIDGTLLHCAGLVS
jgi:GTPase SAR1 family protein